jgi:hypothetical protein
MCTGACWLLVRAAADTAGPQHSGDAPWCATWPGGHLTWLDAACRPVLRMTCCQMLRSSSIRTGLIKKSTAPWVTPRSTVACSPLEDITAGTGGSDRTRHQAASKQTAGRVLTTCNCCTTLFAAACCQAVACHMAKGAGRQQQLLFSWHCPTATLLAASGAAQCYWGQAMLY